MSTVSLPGLSTGIDTKTLVSQLVQAEASRLTAMQEKLVTSKDKKSAVSELETKINTFKTALGNLHSLGNLKAFDTSSGDEDIVTASASATATEGSHTVQVKQLASADRLVHSGEGFSSASTTVGAGTLIISYNYQEFSITTTAETTLTEMVNQINANTDNPGVTASLLEYDDGSGKWHLVLAGDDTGADYQVSIQSKSAEVKTATTALTLKSGGSNASTSTCIKKLATYFGTDTITISGKDNANQDISVPLTVNSYTTIEDLMDAIESAYHDEVHASLDDGILKITNKTGDATPLDVNLTFTDASEIPPDTTLALTTTEGGTQSTSLTAFAAGTFDSTQNAKDALVKVDGYPTDTDAWINRETNSISDIISGVTVNLLATSENDLGGYDPISISLNRNTETVKENMKSMIEAYNAIVTYIDTSTEYDADNKKMGILSDMYSINSIKSLLTSPLRSLAGGFTSSDAFIMPQDIGLEIDADGTLTLDNEAFDEAISEDYMAVMNLIGAEAVGGSSGADAAYISFYGAGSSTDAGSYDVRVTMSGTTITGAQIKLPSEDWSDAREMTVGADGATLYGKTDCDSEGNPLYPEYSMVLTVDTDSGKTEMTTTINIKQGFGDNLYDMVVNMLKADGRLSVAKDSVTDQITQQQDKIDDETTRLENYQSRLEAKFARLEATLSTLQQKLSAITAMG
jgi:flagellar hook-associated protein 2